MGLTATLPLPKYEVRPVDDFPQVTEYDLARGNRWLIALRWVAAAAILVGTLLAAAVFHYPLPTAALCAVGVAVAAYNAALHQARLFIARRYGSQRTPATILANVQIALDLLAVTALVHLTGGATSPVAAYFVFHMIIASYLLAPPAAYGQATLASLLFAAVVTGEHTGFLAHFSVFAAREPVLSALDAAIHVFALDLALFVAVFLASAITHQLREREHQLAEALAVVQEQAQTCEISRAELIRTQELQLRYMRRVSHELRGPLASVGLTLRVLRDGLAGELTPKQRELIVRAEARTETLLDLVDDLLTLSRVQEAPLPEPMQPVVLENIVNDVIESLADTAQAKGVAVIANIPQDLPTFPAQPDGLRTVLLNLVGNGIKYTPSGGRVEISASAEDNPPRVVIAVRDTGMGIAEEDIPRLFEEFFRTEAARQSQIHGTGLGLAIVKLIVEAHNGTVDVASKVGEGSVFTVTLPLTQPPAPEKDAS